MRTCSPITWALEVHASVNKQNTHTHTYTHTHIHTRTHTHELEKKCAMMEVHHMLILAIRMGISNKLPKEKRLIVCFTDEHFLLTTSIALYVQRKVLSIGLLCNILACQPPEMATEAYSILFDGVNCINLVPPSLSTI